MRGSQETCPWKYQGQFFSFFVGTQAADSGRRTVILWIVSNGSNLLPVHRSRLARIAFFSGPIWDRANRVTQACHLKRIASKTRPPTWPYRRLDRSPLSMPLGTSVGAPSRAQRSVLQKVAGQIGGLRRSQ